MAYFTTTPLLGIAGLNAVYSTTSTGPTGLGYPWVSSTLNPLPSVPIEQLFGKIVQAESSDATVGGGGEFIFLRVPTSTTITAGLMYTWGDSGSGYDVTALPTSAGATTTSGAPIAVAINAVTSSSTLTHATWFQ